MTFNEDSRVKIPAIVHLTRLGYSYLPKSAIANLHTDTNIFKDQFKAGLSKINDREFTDTEIDSFLSEINIQLDNSDLGKRFYKSLLGDFACKLIDLENFEILCQPANGTFGFAPPTSRPFSKAKRAVSSQRTDKKPYFGQLNYLEI